MSLTTVPINHITDWAMGPGGRRADGPKTGHALTFILDHLNRADQGFSTRYRGAKLILQGLNVIARSNPQETN